MKTITIAGRVGKDAVTRNTQTGDVTSWSMAVDDGYGDRKSTMWFDCSMWGKRGNTIARFLTKGTPCTVSGDLSQRTHEGKTYLTVNVNDVTLQGKPSERSDQGHQSEVKRMEKSVMDDEIPF